MTSDVLQALKDNDICVVNVPANMTKFYQPLYLTVNGHAKRFLKNKFSIWYAAQITRQLGEGLKIDEVDVKLHLTILKPLHAQWIVDFYNEMTSSKGETIIESGWRAAGISDAIRLGTKNLPPIDPFHEIDPLLQNGLPEAQLVEAVCDLTIEERQLGHSPNEDDGDEDEEVWERSAFDAFREEEKEEEEK